MLFRIAKDRIYTTTKLFVVDWVEAILFVEMNMRTTRNESTYHYQRNGRRPKLQRAYKKIDTRIQTIREYLRSKRN